MAHKDPVRRREYNRMNQARWRSRNFDRSREYEKDYKRKIRADENKHKQELLVRAKWRMLNPDKIARYRKLAESKRCGLDPAKTMLRRLTHAARRARKAKALGSCSFEKWMDRVAFYGWRCKYCRKRLNFETLTQDHVIPLIKGGTNWPSNLVPACKPCNCSKGDRKGPK